MPEVRLRTPSVSTKNQECVRRDPAPLNGQHKMPASIESTCFGLNLNAYVNAGKFGREAKTLQLGVLKGF